MILPRTAAKQLDYYLQHFPAVVILGPRQVGKTTLAHSLQEKAGSKVVLLDMERAEDVEKLRHPDLFLRPLQDHCVIVDEVQRTPALFEALRPLIDEHRVPGRFILLGAASPSIIRGASETLSGRVAYLELTPFSLPEIAGYYTWQSHWLKGGFPEVLQSEETGLAQERLRQFIRTYAERELGMLGQEVTPALLLRLWQMLAHQHAQITTTQDLSNALGVATKTVNRYIDLLEGGFMIRRLQPWFVNLGKRLVKSPKIYLRDSGILHMLLRIGDYESLLGSPVCGASWEGYVVEQIIRTAGPQWDYHFYRTQQGAEVDLLLTTPKGKTVAVEIKFSNAPAISKGFYVSLNDLKPDYAFVITPQTETYAKPQEVTVQNLSDFLMLTLPKLS